MKESVQINGHIINIDVSIWNGKEIIKYDGREMANRRNLRTSLSYHSFTVEEGGESVVYEVQVSGGFVGSGFVIRRNGIIQAHKP